jgi:hypothetical protein
MPALPKTGTGKVEKVKLQRLGLTPTTWDAASDRFVR